MTKEFVQFCVIDAIETHKLYKATNEIIKIDERLIADFERISQWAPEYKTAEDCFESFEQAEENIDNLIAFMREDED